jgi:hypothetical protein
MLHRACLIGLLMLAPGVAAAGTVTVRFEGGFVTVSAQNAPVRDILNEWARQGQTKVVNVEKIPGGLVTLELKHVPEKQALEVLLRSVSGYVAAPRQLGAAGPSAYDRILIMAASAPAQAGPMAPGRMPQRPPTFSPPVAIDDSDEPPPVVLGGPGAIVSEPEDEQDPAQPPFPLQQGQDDEPPAIPDPNAPGTIPTPVVPGPTPLPQGVVTQPAPGQIPVPQVPKP